MEREVNPQAGQYQNLKQRTKRFALEVIRFAERLPPEETSRILRRQLLRAGTSVGANYRAASRARSTPDFISKMGVVEEEADETAYWLELLEESDKVTLGTTASLHREATELVAIAVSSIKTARKSPKRR